MTKPFVDTVILLFVLLNPFLMAVYLLDLIKELDVGVFTRVLARASSIAGIVFLSFAITGDALFTDLLHVRYAAFLIFGGGLFLVIGARYVLEGPGAIVGLRGAPQHVAGSIAMPFMVGPATVNASVLAGSQQPFGSAALAIVIALLLVVVCVLGLKVLHDQVRKSREELIERYVDFVGRTSALLIGTIAVDMILRGVDLWQAAGASK